MIVSAPRNAVPAEAAELFVVAGVAGAGKSSVAGATVRARGADYFDPGDATRALMRADPRLGRVAAEGLAAQQGLRLLERAISTGRTHAFETTLCRRGAPELLAKAAAGGAAIRVWYAGLASPELHIRRLRARGEREVDADAIRQAFHHSRVNLIELLPSVAALRLYDNSTEADPTKGVAPQPRLLLHLQHRRVVGPDNLGSTPDWARPIVAAALRRA